MSYDWTIERVARLRELAAQGLSGAEIAKKRGCGLTRAAIAGKCARTGIMLAGCSISHPPPTIPARRSSFAGPQGLHRDAEPIDDKYGDSSCPKFADDERCIRLTMHHGGLPRFANDEDGRLRPVLVDWRGLPWREISA